MSATFPDEPQLVLSSDPTRPTSIDLSLELERQLEAESLPTSPNPPRPQSLDTSVLATIVTQLRLSLAETTKERDSLAEKLAEARTREEGMRETLEHVTDKCIRMENDLEVATNKHKEDEETIAMLRTKMEESRRALMRLQTEKRMSMTSSLNLDLARPVPAHTSYSGPPSSKRASFVPLTGTPSARMGHRRISSVSDTSLSYNGSPPREPPSWPPASPRSQDILEDAQSTPTAEHNTPSSHNRRVSLLFGRGTVSPPDIPAHDLEIELLRKQLRSMQQQLDDTKRELVESQEAHEASELCSRALRTFISENNVGVPSMKSGASVPTTPSHAKQGSTASRWGFRLWTSAETEPNKPSTPTSTPISTHPPPPAGSTSGQAAPRMFGGLFNARTSISSNSSSRPAYDPVHQEPMFNGSDTSSLADSTGPASPASEPLRTAMGEFGEHSTSGEGKIVDGKIHIKSPDHTQEIPVTSVA